jgi:hypothetical protein
METLGYENLIGSAVMIVGVAAGRNRGGNDQHGY